MFKHGLSPLQNLGSRTHKAMPARYNEGNNKNGFRSESSIEFNLFSPRYLLNPYFVFPKTPNPQVGFHLCPSATSETPILPTVAH